MPSTETHRDLKWYKITAERVGNIGRLNVRLVKPVYVGKTAFNSTTHIVINQVYPFSSSFKDYLRNF